ncbi:hypothetical protein GLOIN_2v1725482 [Rhizophagus clarus]|uniref:Uncharacterized protein n=1 Tax=Rhizophagus clarus TaxID=94130 RepID=A0A8H3LAL1_9GLOM|nr:hypothetical protein GLOIN_2v1725482 [Rhizophagus clarus]
MLVIVNIYRHSSIESKEHLKYESKEQANGERYKTYNTTKLISFLRDQDLGLDKDDLKIIRKEKVNGRRDFSSQQNFQDYGMKGGLAKRLANFAKECKKIRLRSFSSYKIQKDLSEVLEEYGILSRDITRIPQFIPRK